MSFELVSFFYIYICCFTAEGRGVRTVSNVVVG